LGGQESLDDIFLGTRTLAKLIGGADRQRGPAILTEVIATLRRRGRERPWSDPAFVLALTKIDDPALDAARLTEVLALFPGEAEALGEIAARIAPDTQSESRQRLVADALARIPEDLRQRVRSALAKLGAWGLLRTELFSVFRSASDKDGSLRQHGEALRSACPEFLEKEWSRAASTCWKVLPQDKRTQLAPHWLEGSAGRLPPEIAQECVRLAASTVPMSDDPRATAFAEQRSQFENDVLAAVRRRSRWWPF
jgi:hypothetical protein